GSLKQSLRMDVLRGRSPGLVRKEVGAHLRAYILLRGVMAEAARAAGLLPMQLSFKGALQAVNAFAAALWTAGPAESEALCRRLREAGASHRVGDRPHRWEAGRGERGPQPDPLVDGPRGRGQTRLGASGFG